MAEYKLNHNTTLMQDYRGGAPISHSGPLFVSGDKNGRPLVFGINDQHNIHALVQSDGTETGWLNEDLMFNLPTDSKPKLLASARHQDGSIIVVAAVTDKTGADLLYRLDVLSTPIKNIQWHKLGAAKGLSLVAISVGHDKHGNALIMVTAKEGDKTINFLIEESANHQQLQWQKVPSPINSAEVLTTSIGRNAELEKIPEVTAIAYSLQKTAAGKTALVMTSLPDFSFYNHEILLPHTIDTFATALDKTGSSLLAYSQTDAKGQGHMFALDITSQMARSASLVKPVTINQIPLALPCQQLLLTSQNSGKMDVWARAKDHRLYHATCVETKWNEPLPFAEGVGNLDSFHNPATGAIDLFSIDLDNNLSRHLQDSVSTRWLNHPVRLLSTGPVKTLTAYQTLVQLSCVKDSDAKDNLLANSAITLAAKERCVLKVNEQVYDVWPQSPVLVKTDLKGDLTIVNQTESLAVPEITLSSDQLNAVTIEPMGQIKATLSTVSADELASAPMQTESYGKTEPMLPQASSHTVAGAHKAIQQLSGIAKKLPASKSLAEAQDFTPFALDFTQEQPVYTELTAGDLQGSIVSGIEHAFGDMWNAIKHGLVKVEHIICHAVKDGLQLIVKLASQTFKVLAKFAEQVWQVIEHVLKVIGAELKKLLAWLGEIFKWKDILLTHQVIKAMYSVGIKDIQGKIGDWETLLNNALDRIPAEIFSTNLKQATAGMANRVIPPKKTEQPQELDLLASAPLSAAATQWAQSVFINKNTAAIKSAVPAGLKNKSTPPVVPKIATGMEAIANDIYQLYLSSFDSVNVGQWVGALEEDVVKELVEIIKAVADALLDGAEDIVGGITEALSTEINIPVLTSLYEKVLVPGSKATQLDINCLIAAISATDKYYQHMGKAPFTKSQADALSACDTFEAFIACLQQNTSLSAKGTELAAAQSEASAAPNFLMAIIVSTMTGIYTYANATVSIVDEDEAEMASVEDLPGLVSLPMVAKLASGVLIYITSLISTSIVVDESEKHGVQLEGRALGLEVGINYGQIVFVIIDAIGVGLAANETEYASLPIFEGILGAINGALSGLLFGLEESENSSESVNNSTKLIQNLCGCAQQIGAVPAALPSVRAKLAAEVMIVCGGGGQSFLNFMRALADYHDNRLHQTY